MTSPSTSWWTCSRLVSRTTLAYLTAWLCGAAALGWVALHAGPRTGTAIVHVTESDVVVNVGGRIFQVSAATELPLICDLPVGDHRLVMSRGDSVLHSDQFSIEGGEDRVLTAWISASGDTQPKVWTPNIDPRSTAFRVSQGLTFSWGNAPSADLLSRFTTGTLAVNLWSGFERVCSTVVCATGPWSAFAVRIPNFWSPPWPGPQRAVEPATAPDHAHRCTGRAAR